jgi:hypothetical protein
LLDDPTDASAAKRALVRTYNTPKYNDPWDSVQDYERVQEASGKHPNKKSGALSRIVELPRGRIRAWVDGDGMPDCYRGLQAALEHGWILDSWQSEQAHGLNRLAAWACASGSIDDRFAPYFVVDPEFQDIFEDAVSKLGVRMRRTREDESKPPEWTPRKPQTVLGRVIHTWTGLRGDKSATTTRFPRYLRFAPDDVAESFARTYVSLRASDIPQYAQPNSRIQEIRSDDYRRDLVELLERVVDDPSEIRGRKYPIDVVGDAATRLSFVGDSE